VRMILCEKPMADSLRACDEMIEACRAAGVRLAINHQMRFMEQYTLPKSLVDSEALGGLGSVIVSAGNFGMAMNGTHYFEMFRYMTGEAATFVSAWFSSDAVPNPRGPQFVDVAGSIRIETATGRRFYMDCSSDQGHGMLATYNCRNGRIVIDELLGEAMIATRDPEHRSAPTTRYGMPHTIQARSLAPADAVAPTRSVMEALLAGHDYPTGEDGRAAMAVLVAAHMSNAQGGAKVRMADAAAGLQLPIA
jgi:predicted dehydrogenase